MTDLRMKIESTPEFLHDRAVVRLGPGLVVGRGRTLAVQAGDQARQVMDAGPERALDGIAQQAFVAGRTAFLRLLRLQVAVVRLARRRLRVLDDLHHLNGARSEERRVGKECRSRWSPY